MKCPRCSFVASNKKDICPRCEFDLRPKKRELGLPVYNSNASIEQLAEEQRSITGSAPQAQYQTAAPYSDTPPADEAPAKTSVWKKLFGKKDTPTVDDAVSETTTASKKKDTPRPFKVPAELRPKKSEDTDPLLEHLEALEREIAHAGEETEPDESGAPPDLVAVPVAAAAPVVSADGGLELPTAPAPTAAIVLSAEPSPPDPVLPASKPTPVVRESDLEELLSALDDLGLDESTPQSEVPADDALFSASVPSIDSNLDEIMHALDELTPEQDIDDIELFETKFNDLAESMSTGVAQAQSATENLQNQDFGDIAEILETLAPEAEAQTPVETVETLDFEPEPVPASEPEIEPDSPSSEHGTGSHPAVSPEVLSFDDSGTDFDKALDEMIGDDVLDVTAVKQKKESKPARTEPGAVMTDDGMEISFEVEVEGSEEGIELELAPEPPAEPEQHDPILSDLLSTYQSLEESLEHRSIAPEHSAPHEPMERPPAPMPVTDTDSSLPHVAFAQTITNTVSTAKTHEQLEAVLAKLPFLSEEIVDELRGLFYRNSTQQSIRAAAEAIPVMPAAVPSPLSEPVEGATLAALENELSEELAALASEGLTIYAHENAPIEAPLPDASTIEIRGSEEEVLVSQAELDALAKEFDTEFEALKSEGFSTIAGEVTVEVPFAPSEPEPSAELELLAEELGEELDALESEGCSLYHEAEQVSEPVDSEPSEPAQHETVTELEAELDQEFAALEEEGFSSYAVAEEHVESEIAPELISSPDVFPVETIVPETLPTMTGQFLAQDIERAVETEPVSEPEAETKSEPLDDEAVSELEAELDQEFAALEDEGFSPYTVPDSSPDVSPVETIVPETLPNMTGQFLAQDIERAIETEPVSEPEAETKSEPLDDEAVSELEAEPDQEFAALEGEGFSPYTVPEEPISSDAAPESELEEEPEAPFAEALPNSTGQFLVQDFERLVDLVADEKVDEPSGAETEEHHESDEIDLSELARFFNADVPAAATVELEEPPIAQRLDGAVNTGTFLVSDLERIISAVPPGNGTAAPNIDPELWRMAEAELAADRSGEVEINAGQLGSFKQNAAVDVLFDLAEEELGNPGVTRRRISSIPTSEGKTVENSSLKDALTKFEREERILSKRRSKNADAGLTEEKPIVIVPAPWTRRLGAAVIDAVVIFFASAVLAWWSILSQRGLYVLKHFKPEDFYIILPEAFQFCGLTYLVWLVFNTVLTTGWGQTVGGHVARIEVVTLRGNIPGPKQAALRAMSMTTTLLSCGLGLLPLFGTKKRAAHDTISRTAVRVKSEE